MSMRLTRARVREVLEKSLVVLAYLVGFAVFMWFYMQLPMGG